MSEDLDRLIAASSSCDLDEVDYPYVNVNPSVDQGSDDPQDLDPEFKASSLLMAMDSGDDIQATPETCLLINKTLQEVVNDLLKIIAKEIQGIEVSKLHIVPPSVVPKTIGGVSTFENGLSTDTTVDFSAIPSSSRPDKLIQKSIHAPFFQSRDLSRPPLNHEAALRRQRGEFNLPDFVPLLWRKADNQRLIRAVALDCRQRRLQRLTRELHKKEEEYNEWLIAGPKSKALKKEKDALTYQIAQLQISSDESFVNCEMSQADVDQIDWMKISAFDFDGAISDRNLRLIWMNQFNKANNYGSWSKEEDTSLSNAIVRFGLHSWEEVAKAVGTNRTPFMCIQRYQQRLAPRQTLPETSQVDLDGDPTSEKPWTTAEDARLLDLVKMATDEQGVIHWTFVNAQAHRRTLNSCRRRWAEISPNIQSGPFTEREDLQLLLGVQRHGSENFDLVAAKCLSHRDARDCRKRYLQLTRDLASEWTYDEDRKLFLLMEKVEETYRMRINAGPTQNILIPPRCYKDLLIHLPGRTWQTIRNRHRMLKSWNIAYHKLRQMVCRKHDVSNEDEGGGGDDSDKNSDISADNLQAPPNGRWTQEEVRAVFLRTPFMLNLLEKLQSAGAHSAEFIRDIFSSEAATKTEALESGRPLTINLELDPMLRDAAEGIIVPRPLTRDRWLLILRHTEVRMLLEARVRNQLQEQLDEELKRRGIKDTEAAMSGTMVLPSKRAQVLRTLMEDEDHFLLSMEQSLRHPSIASSFEDFRSVSGYLNLVPQIVKRCISDTHSLLLRRETAEPPQKPTVKDPQPEKEAGGEAQVEGQVEKARPGNSVPGEVDDEEEEALVQLEIRRRIKSGLLHRPGRAADVLLMHKLKRCFEIFCFRRRLDRVHRLKRWRKTPMEGLESSDPDARRKVFQLLAAALRSGNRELERVHLQEVAKRGRAKLVTLPPNGSTLNAFRLLLHQRPQLLTRGHFHLEAFFRLQLETVEPEDRGAMREEMQSFSQEDHFDRPVKRPRRMFEKLLQNYMLDDHRQLLRDPRYLLLKARIFALFLWPTLLSAGKIEDYYSSLQESVNLSRQQTKDAQRPRRKRRRNYKQSQKWQFFQTIRKRIEERHAAAGVDTNMLLKARRTASHWHMLKRMRREPCEQYRLRSAPVLRPDLVRAHVSENKCLLMPFAALELMRDGYQLDSYFPIDNENNAVDADEAASPRPARVVKQELMDE